MGEKDNVKFLERQIRGKPVYLILLYTFIITLIVLLVYIGLIITATYKIGEGEAYALFRDILIIFMTMLGLALTALGYGIYQSILKHAEKSMKKREEDFIVFSTALLFLNMGYFHWQHYEIDYEEEVKKENKQKAYALQEENKQKPYALHHRNLAIDLTKEAYKIVLKLDVSERRNEELKCQIMNNLGWYLAEGDKDNKFSKRCAQYLKERIDKFPDRGEEWQDTINNII